MATSEEVLEEVRLVLEDGGERSEFGCTLDMVESAKAYVRRLLPHKYFCVVEDWAWLNVEVPAKQKQDFAQEGVSPAFIFAKSVVEDQARRAHIGPMVKTSLLIKLHERCVFETENTAYILSGPGRTLSVSVSAANSIRF